MRITVLGAGAMGMLFGGYLSAKNEVYLVEVNKERVDYINANGVRVREKDGTEKLFRPTAVSTTEGLGNMDLVIVFVKSMYTVSALETNKCLIGPETYLMTLQNGAGHESKLLQFTDKNHVIIGSTQHNSSIIENGFVNHGGSGKTSIGLLNGNSSVLDAMAADFTSCGLECVSSNEVKKQIWTKLFTNTAASSLTAVLQMPLGYIYDNEYAHSLMVTLCKEAVSVANAEGFAVFDENEVIKGVEEVCKNAPLGYTSIYADIRDGRRTEVDTISGSVVEAGKRLGVSVPCHETIVSIIHAMEQRNQTK